MVLGNNELRFEVFAVLPLVYSTLTACRHSYTSVCFNRSWTFRFIALRLVNSLIFFYVYLSFQYSFFRVVCEEPCANWRVKKIDTWLIYSISQTPFFTLAANHESPLEMMIKMLEIENMKKYRFVFDYFVFFSFIRKWYR
jgi:hypothetical protein